MTTVAEATAPLVLPAGTIGTKAPAPPPAQATVPPPAAAETDNTMLYVLGAVAIVVAIALAFGVYKLAVSGSPKAAEGGVQHVMVTEDNVMHGMSYSREGGAGSVSRAPTPSQQPASEWSRHVDTGSGRPYWHNSQTNQTTWNDPASAPAPAPAPMPARQPTPALSAAAPEWTQHSDPNSGRAYWHNKTTGATSWSPPPAGTAHRDNPASWQRGVTAASAVGAFSFEVPAARIQASVPAASDWAEHKDPGSGRPYWHNRRTGVTSWTPP